MDASLDNASLVEDGLRHFGRFARTPIANPLDAFTGAARTREWFRTKEWVGFTLVHPHVSGSMIIQDAKYLATSELYLAGSTLPLVQHAANRPGGIGLPSDLMHSTFSFLSGGYRLGYRFGEYEVIVSVDIDATKQAPAVQGRLFLRPRQASRPLVVSVPLPGGGTMYTNKIVFPASGQLTCGDQTFVFDAERDFAILDEHKSHLPYSTHWTWGTFATHTPEGIVGANFATRPSLPDEPEESALWTPDAVEPLSDIAFEHAAGDLDAPWHIASADGRLDVTFTPVGHKRVDQSFGVVAIHYTQWFGTYSGTLRGENKAWQFEDVHGACEQMDARL